MQTVVITGGTGMVGKALSNELLERGYKVIILTRNKNLQAKNNLEYAYWNVAEQQIDQQAILQADYIIHLAGAGIAEKRWTDKRKNEILESRVKSANLICKTLQSNPHKVKAVISTSAIGWYGPDPIIPNPTPFVETNPPATDFLGKTCQLWEQSMQPIKSMGLRLVILRLGIVLSNDGGALKEFKKPLKFGLATIMGSGKQYISWIHISDLVNVYATALRDDSYDGVYNAVAPNPVKNETLVHNLAEIARGKFYTLVNAPVFALKWGLGEMSIEVLKSCTVSNHKIQNMGFVFMYPNIHGAIQNLVAAEQANKG